MIANHHRASVSSPQIQPVVLWLTGLSGAGESTLAKGVQQVLDDMNTPSYVLDGDKLRAGLCSDLGFSPEDRLENIRRITNVAQLFCDAGLVVICATISPFEVMRQKVKSSFAEGQWIEVFVDAPLSVCEARDPKGLYQNARKGNIKEFTGIDSPYEPPISPDIHVITHVDSIDECVNQVIEFLVEKNKQIKGHHYPFITDTHLM